MSARDVKAASRAINTILWRDWDPIGCGVPEDEYESYVWPLYTLLTDGGSREAVSDYLRETADVQIGVSVAEDRHWRVVDKLLSLKLATSED